MSRVATFGVSKSRIAYSEFRNYKQGMQTSTWLRESLSLGQLRSGILASYERACAAGTRASTEIQWRDLAASLVDVGAKAHCASMARTLFDRADDCLARAARSKEMAAYAGIAP
jgi:hypothetical protein